MPTKQDLPVETEWQFDAIDVRPVERWLAALPAGADPPGSLLRTVRIDGDGGPLPGL